MKLTKKIKRKIDKYFKGISPEELHRISVEKYGFKERVERGKVDLRECEPGDILISALGVRLKYVGPAPENSYYDHEVEYEEPGLGNGTRTHDGYVMRHNRKPEIDHDIVEIIHIKKDSKK